LVYINMSGDQIKLMGNWRKILNSRDRISGRNRDLEYSWDAYDKGLQDYSIFFEKVCPDKKAGLKLFVENTLSDRRGQAVGVDVGGPGLMLFQGFDPNFFYKTIGAILLKRYEYSEILDEKHTIIEADCLKARGLRRLKNSLGGDGKVDILFERMLGGIKNYPASPEYLWSLLNNLYKLLRTGGMMFAQSPDLRGKEDKQNIQNWLDNLQNNSCGSLELKHASMPSMVHNVPKEDVYEIIYLRKLEGAPDDLPR